MTTLQALPLPSNLEDLCELFLLYIAYSTLGWCGEMLYCSIPKGSHLRKERLPQRLSLPHLRSRRAARAVSSARRLPESGAHVHLRCDRHVDP